MMFKHNELSWRSHDETSSLPTITVTTYGKMAAFFRSSSKVGIWLGLLAAYSRQGGALPYDREAIMTVMGLTRDRDGDLFDKVIAQLSADGQIYVVLASDGNHYLFYEYCDQYLNFNRSKRSGRNRRQRELARILKVKGYAQWAGWEQTVEADDSQLVGIVETVEDEAEEVLQDAEAA